MNSVRQCVYDALKNQNISYEVMEHPAAFTIEEMAQLNISCMDKVVKNLFSSSACQTINRWILRRLARSWASAGSVSLPRSR